ncbi:MAG: ParB/RepB/Spo0J family partition protein [Planctomycetota bacterium]
MLQQNKPNIQGERIGVLNVSIDDLIPHPLNSNKMPVEFKEKLKAHIKRSGKYPFIIVRPHPDDPGKYQILDGHHRVVILKELGLTEARCDVWDVSDRESKLLLATLNRLEGQDLPIKRARLIHELLSDMNTADLAGLLPEDDRQIEELHALLEFPAEEIAAQLEDETAQMEKVMPKVMTFVVTPEQEEIIEQAVERASDGTKGRDRKARGLTHLATHYLEERAQ